MKSGSGYPANDARTTTDEPRAAGATDRSEEGDTADDDDDEESAPGARGVATAAERNVELGVDRTRRAEGAALSSIFCLWRREGGRKNEC